MSGPIDRAYLGLAEAVRGALAGSGFLISGDKLEVDPSSPSEPDGESGDIQSTAQLFKGATEPLRTFLGNPPRYAVEREAMLELAICGPDDARAQALASASAACAKIPLMIPAVGGAERVELRGAEADDLPPNGEKLFLTFVLRVRSGDVLGLSD